MKQNAVNLLPGTMVKNKIGEIGRLVKMAMNPNGQYCWVIDWQGRGHSVELTSQVQGYELA